MALTGRAAERNSTGFTASDKTRRLTPSGSPGEKTLMDLMIAKTRATFLASVVAAGYGFHAKAPSRVNWRAHVQTNCAAPVPLPGRCNPAGRRRFPVPSQGQRAVP